MKLSKKPASKSHRVLLFGPPKSGKSLLAGKLAEEFNLIWIDMENGYDVLFQLPLDQQERIEIIALPDTRSYPIAIETCLKLIKGQKGKVCEAHGKFNCMVCAKDNAPTIEVDFNNIPLDTIVVFDSLTQLTNSGIANITKLQPDDYKLQQDDWGNLGKLMDTFLSHVQQAPFHVLCISHETEAEMENGKNKLVPTAGTRNFSRNSAKYFDEVLYCEVKNKRHVVGSSTVYNGNILTGSRSGAVLEGQATPSLIPIFKGAVQKTAQPSNISNIDTPGQKAVSSLAEMAARMKAVPAKLGDTSK